MVINQAVATAVVFLLFVTAGGLPLRPALDGTALRQLWPVAGPQLAAVVLMVGKYRIFLLSLGILLAETALAHANVAFRMLDAALVVVWSTVTRIAMPRLCALQHDRAALARCYGEMAQLPPLIGLPIALGVALVVEDLVAALLGPAWAGTAEAAQVAAIAARLTFLHGDQFALFIALGQARWNTLAAVANFATPLLALVVLRPETPAAPRWPGARGCWC